MVSRTQLTGDWFWEVTICSTIEEAARVVAQFVDRAQKWGARKHDLLALQYGMHEAIVNAVRHGNGGGQEKQVRVAYRSLGDDVWMEIEDEGPGFQALAASDPTTVENRKRPGGRGLMMMRHFMTSVDHNDQGNRVTMQKQQARRRRISLRARHATIESRQQFASDDFQLI